MKPSLTMLVHGEAGVGKTRLLATAPPPVCFLDLEGRARYVPEGPKVAWDVLRDAPPEAGDWTHCLATAPNFKLLQKAYEWLQSERHPFRSVVVDSLSFAQKRFIDDLVGVSQLKESDWGEVLRVLETQVRDFCDLTLTASNPVEVVAYSAGTKSVDGRRTPLLSGALRDTCAYQFDAVGYLYLGQDTTGQTTRNLLLEPQQGIVAKDNTDRLGGPIVQAPDITKFYSLASE